MVVAAVDASACAGGRVHLACGRGARARSRATPASNGTESDIAVDARTLPALYAGNNLVLGKARIAVTHRIIIVICHFLAPVVIHAVSSVVLGGSY